VASAVNAISPLPTVRAVNWVLDTLSESEAYRTACRRTTALRSIAAAALRVVATSSKAASGARRAHEDGAIADIVTSGSGRRRRAFQTETEILQYCNICRVCADSALGLGIFTTHDPCQKPAVGSCGSICSDSTIWLIYIRFSILIVHK
jgi:hypothetical protein